MSHFMKAKLARMSSARQPRAGSAFWKAFSLMAISLIDYPGIRAHEMLTI